MGMHKAIARGVTESPAMQALIDWLEDYSEDMLAMLVRAFTVTVMCLAMRVLSEYIYDDVATKMKETALHDHVDHEGLRMGLTGYAGLRRCANRRPSAGAAR